MDNPALEVVSDSKLKFTQETRQFFCFLTSSLNNFFLGTGFDGDQCLGVQLMELGKKKKQILHGDPLSLTKKSYLAWVGFSAEGMKYLHE